MRKELSVALDENDLEDGRIV